MGVLCIITALLGLERIRKALSYMCVFIILFVLFCGGMQYSHQILLQYYQSTALHVRS
jgi:hypothetical protein